MSGFSGTIDSFDTVQSITAGSSSTPPVINRDSAWTIVAVASGGDNYVQLPSGSQVGDLVELYESDGGGQYATVVAASGESIVWNGNATSLGAGLYRKLTNTKWGTLQPVAASG
jgi:hypothetical protein